MYSDKSMNKDNAYNFIDNCVYRNLSREEELKNTSNNEEFMKLIVKMAESENWPTGNFDENDVKEALDSHARSNSNQELFNPYPYETLIRLVREGKVGGAVAIW